MRQPTFRHRTSPSAPSGRWPMRSYCNFPEPRLRQPGAHYSQLRLLNRLSLPRCRKFPGRCSLRPTHIARHQSPAARRPEPQQSEKLLSKLSPRRQVPNTVQESGVSRPLPFMMRSAGQRTAVRRIPECASPGGTGLQHDRSLRKFVWPSSGSMPLYPKGMRKTLPMASLRCHRNLQLSVEDLETSGILLRAATGRIAKQKHTSGRSSGDSGRNPRN